MVHYLLPSGVDYSWVSHIMHQNRTWRVGNIEPRYDVGVCIWPYGQYTIYVIHKTGETCPESTQVNQYKHSSLQFPVWKWPTIVSSTHAGCTSIWQAKYEVSLFCRGLAMYPSQIIPDSGIYEIPQAEVASGRLVLLKLSETIGKPKQIKSLPQLQ